MVMSTSSAPARPMRSAPIPRAGNSTRCGSRCSSPTTISAASRADVPGQDPMPVPAAKRALEERDRLSSLRQHYSPHAPHALVCETGRSRHACPLRPADWRSLCAAALLAAGCAHTIQGTATRAAPGIDDESRSPVDVESVMLDQSQMRAITGAGEEPDDRAEHGRQDPRRRQRPDERHARRSASGTSPRRRRSGPRSRSSTRRHSRTRPTAG